MEVEWEEDSGACFPFLEVCQFVLGRRGGKKGGKGKNGVECTEFLALFPGVGCTFLKEGGVHWEGWARKRSLKTKKNA